MIGILALWRPDRDLQAEGLEHTISPGGVASFKVWRYYFGYLQKDSDFYNTWAAALYPHTDAYNFAYTDRVVGGKVAIHWDATAPKAIDTIVITILPDLL